MDTWPTSPNALAERHLVLVGLPGAGKTSVGRLAATLLGRTFLDFDEEIEQRASATIGALFAAEGEPAFRARELDLSAELAGRAPMVLSPGGGWMANAPAAATLRPVARIIYLRVSPAVALDRMGTARSTRPLLAGDDPAAALQRLLDRRSAVYAMADHVLDTDALSEAEVAESLVAITRELERAEA